MKTLFHCLPGGYNRCIVDLTQEGLEAWDVKLTEEENDSGELVFTIADKNPEFNGIATMLSEIVIMDGERECWRGRVTEQQLVDFWQKSITCKGLLDYLYDGLVMPQTFDGSAPAVLNEIVTLFNASTVDVQKHFVVGIIAGICDIVYEMKKPQKAWALLSSLLKEHGGSIRARRDGEINYIDWLAEGVEYRPVCSQQAVYGENLTSLKISSTGEDLATVLYGRGKNGLTFDVINEGKPYVIHEEAAAQFGHIEDVYELSEVEVAEDLLSAATAELEERISQVKTIEAGAIDLSTVDPAVEPFAVGAYVPLVSQVHEIDELALIKRIENPVFNPSKMEITLGASLAAASRIMRRSL